MRQFLCASGCVGLLLTAALSAPAADVRADPLRLLPADTELVFKVEQPRRLVEALLNHQALSPLRELEAVRELYDSTNYRRFHQLVTYFEKQLGLKWPEALQRLAGGGVAVGIKFGTEPAPTLAVIQGVDADLLQRFSRLALDVVTQELARRDAPEKVEHDKYRDLDTVHIGKDFHAAVVGSALLLSNSKQALHRGIDLRRDGRESLAAVPGVAAARRLLPPDPFAWAWLNLETVRKAPQAKEVFAQPRNDAILTVLFGGWLDVARRSAFLCGGLYGDTHRMSLALRMPAGREGMPAELAVHAPLGDQSGAPPLLEPRGVLYSSGFYLDLSEFWQQRKKLFNERQVSSFQDFDKKSALFLLGRRFSQLTAQAGTRFRYVVVNEPNAKYPVGRTGLDLRLGFALVANSRDPAFGKSMESVLRAAALLASTQVKLQLVEERHAGVALVAYRPEGAAERRPQAEQNPLANLVSPCFATVGDQFFVASSLELGRELVDLLQREARDRHTGPAEVSVQSRVYGAGGADFLETIQDQLLAQAVLNQALSPGEAQQQVRRFIAWVRGLGNVEFQVRYAAEEFQVDLRYAPRRLDEKQASRTAGR
jgi:hypothetical protein